MVIYKKRYNAVSYIKKGQNITYNIYTKEIIKPKKYYRKGAVLVDEPIFEKVVSINMFINRIDPDESIISLTIESNFDPKKLEKKEKGSSFSSIDMFEKKKVGEKWYIKYNFAMPKEKNFFIIRLQGNDVLKTFDCDIDKSICKERKGIEL